MDKATQAYKRGYIDGLLDKEPALDITKPEGTRVMPRLTFKEDDYRNGYRSGQNERFWTKNK